MKRFDLVVVGAGPAGIAAAVTAAQRGLKVTLVDESPRVGGQVLFVAGNAREYDDEGQAIKRGYALRSELDRLPITVETRTIVWGIKGCRIATTGPGGTQDIEASAIIIATGAREFVPPFPGWTLPGVMTLGGAQHLIKRHGILPGNSILIAGAGPLMWALAATALENDGNVVAILDASRPSSWIAALPQLPALRDRIGLGLHYLNVIRAHRVPYHFERDRLLANGTDQITGVTVGGRRYDLDTLCIGFGFRPNIELLQLAGCALTFDPSLGGWIPVIDETFQTNQAGIFAAGECTGVGGAEKALLEGELAAFSALKALCHHLSSEDQDRVQRLRRRRRSEIRFSRILNKACEPGFDYLRKLEDETLVCRCESIRAGQIRQALQHEITTLDGLKNELRVGQGMCQGRTCGPILQWLISEKPDRSGIQPSPFHARPPVKPVALDQVGKHV